MRLTGKEIRDALEMSYDLWTNRMKSPDDHILLFREKRREGATDRASFKKFQFQLRFCGGYYLHGGCDQAGWGEGNHSQHGRRYPVRYG